MLTGTFYAVTKPGGEFVWLAVHDETTDRFWVYDPGTDSFHVNTWLTLDFEVDQDLNYAPVTRAHAVTLTGARTRPVTDRVLVEHVADTGAVPAAEVFTATEKNGSRS